MYKIVSLSLLGTCLFSGAITAAESTLLLRQPDISAQHITFVYGGDIWIADRQGNNPVQLTSHPASEFSPRFSPDGQWIAFSASYDNNTDVYVMPVTGGEARRLTWHPGADVVNGWSADGKKVLFSSNREIANSRSNQLYEVAVSGGYEQKVMDAVAFEGRWSADGKKLAYRPNNMAYSGSSGWRQHRGGSTPPIWIIDLEQQQLEKIPHPNANDFNPLWAGDSVLFLSDRNDGAVNLFSYNNKTVSQLTKEQRWDIRSAGVYQDTVIYEAGGQLKTLNLSNNNITPLDITLNVQSAQARPQWKDAAKNLTSAKLSATGQRVVVSARGEVFTVPVKDGSVRNLTQSSGIKEFDALWSADGSKIAYLSDEGNKHQLVITSQDGINSTHYPLADKGYFNLLAWSADNNLIAYQDNHLNLYVFNLAQKRSEKIDSSERRAPFSVSFSPDSRYLAYTVSGQNYFSQIKLFDFNSRRSSLITDGMSHADNPVFSQDYLFFTASVNTGPAQVGLDMSTQERAVRQGIYAAVLTAEGKSPLLPLAGDEPQNKAASDKKSDDKAAKTPPVKIDLAGIGQRFVALPIAERNYDTLAVANDGSLFYLERTQPGISNELPGSNDKGATLYRFDFEEKESNSVKQGVDSFSLSADGKKLLTISGGSKLEIADTAAKAEFKAVDLSAVKMYLEPRQEWQQIFNDTWRMQQEYFYDPAMHGIDWQAVYDRYQPLLKHVQRREDLNDVLVEMIAELQVGHNRVGGGDIYQEASTRTGLLGADFIITDNRYQLKTVYQGDRWNGFLKAPLAVPGASAKAGDFILTINGQPLDASDNIFARLDNTLGKQVVLTIADNSKGKNQRNITVEPIANEAALRQWHWIEQNQKLVHEKTDGKVAYVYLPNTTTEGFRYFNRMYFAQIDKQAVILDDRKNGGGQAANYITDVLSRPYLSGWKDRDGLIFNTPGGAIYGPKTMLIDQDAGSGGDFLPWAFKRLQLGKTIGTRTWGGLIGISANPNLIDGGFLVVPFFRFFTPDGEWRVENEGVAPDIEVELDPIAVNQGRDVQLERAIAETLQQLEASPPSAPHQQAPAMPEKLGL